MADRIQKILARAGLASRRQAEEMISTGRVTVNGTVAQLGDSADPSKDAVKLDGRRVTASRGPQRYILVNKPRNVVSTVADPEGRPTVIDLLPQSYHRGLFPVGRLDFDSEGLMLLTDDGDLAQHVAHPRYGCGKTYEVKLRGTPDEVALDKLRRGIVLDGRRTAPTEITRRSGIKGSRDATTSTWWRVVLREGRTRQIRQMFFRVGHSVMRLRRVAIGPVRDSELRRGDWRELSEAEVALLRRITAHPKPRVTAANMPRRARGGPVRSASRASGTARPARAGAVRSAAPRSASPRAGSPRSGSPRSGSPRSGFPRSGSPHSGSPRSGSPRSGSPRSGSPRSGSPRSGSPRSGSPRSGSPRSGSPRSGSPRSGFPRSGSPRSGSPRSGGPRAAKPRLGTSARGGARGSSPRGGAAGQGRRSRGGAPRSSGPRSARGPRRSPRRGGGR